MRTNQALGQTILLSQPPEVVSGLLPLDVKAKPPTRSVVLIDEIDNAPHDLPNDVLNEIEQMEFRVKETGRVFKAEPHNIAPLSKVKVAKARLERLPGLLKKFRQSVLAAACSGRLTEEWREGKDWPEWEEVKLIDTSIDF